MIIDEDIYLEHFGVKGMRWGVRKQQSETTRQSRAQSARREALKSGVKAGVIYGAIGAGAAFALYKMGDSGTRTSKINGLSATRKGQQAVRSSLKKIGPKKVASISPALRQRAMAATKSARSGPSMSSSAAKHLSSITSANKTLTTHYNKFNVPIPKRELLDTSYWESLARVGR